MNKTAFRLLCILCVHSFLGQVLIYPRLPATVPIHWNAADVIDNYGPKWMALLLAALPLVLVLGLWALPKIDPRRKNFEKHAKAYTVTVFAGAGILIAASWVTSLVALGIRLPVGKILSILVGLSFVFMGNYMPQLRSNFFAGVRTPWALADERVWRKTQRAGGILFCLLGAGLVLCAFVETPFASVLPLVLMLPAIVGLYVYSYLVYKRLPTEQNPQHNDSQNP